jgi:hypothetical protein
LGAVQFFSWFYASLFSKLVPSTTLSVTAGAGGKMNCDEGRMGEYLVKQEHWEKERSELFYFDSIQLRGIGVIFL